ncbi:MAG: hypothetical protein WDO56_26175 [Gammaproteobacteria bacterium]
MRAHTAWAENRTITGSLVVDPPTLMALGFAWNIDGDDNRNAHVTVAYRKKGTDKWLPALDLMRIQNEQIWTRGATDLTAPNMFAGSIFDLAEATDYEVTLSLQDRMASPAKPRKPSPFARALSRSRQRMAASSTSTRPDTPVRGSSPHSQACSRPTTWHRSVATGAARRRRAFALATPSRFTPGCISASTITTPTNKFALHHLLRHAMGSALTI